MSEVEDLTEPVGVVPVVFEILRQGHDIGLNATELGLQIPALGRVRPLPGEQTYPRRTANRLLAVGMLKDSTHGCKSIDIRGFDDSAAITTEFRP